METTLLKMLLISSVSGQFGKYPVYVGEKKTWSEAQSYCREHHYDLFSIKNQTEEMRLKEEISVTFTTLVWIGLYREPEDLDGWKWSGGGNASYRNWVGVEPNNYKGKEFYVGVCWKCGMPDGWYDAPNTYTLPFFCSTLVVMEEKKTWEEALEHCREHHANLTSLVSANQVLQAQKEIQGTQTPDPMWIGLRYLGNRWLWVNGDPLEYKAWTPGGDQQMCPSWSRSCGALTKEGLWENRNCQEKLYFICD